MIWIEETFAPLDNSDFDKPLEDSFFNHFGENPTFKKEKLKAKPLIIFSNSEPVKSNIDKHSSSNVKTFNTYSLFAMHLIATLFNPLIFSWISSTIVKNYLLFCTLSIGEIIDMACLLAAPLLWMFLAYTIMYGKEIIFNVYPEVAKEAKMSPPRHIRCHYEQSNRRFKKKYFKANKSRSNQQTV